jgi:membrane-associated phospholipid phosphatase
VNGLRAAELITLGFLAYAMVATLWFPVGPRQRLVVVGLNLVAASAVVLAAKRARSSLVSFLRDALPTVLILLAYREAGLFLSPDPAHHLDHVFVAWDSWLLRGHVWLPLWVLHSPWLENYMEAAYLLCYPFVPLGFACVLIRGPGRSLGQPDDRQQTADRFWTAVLSALFFSYVLYPYFPLIPPHQLFHDEPFGASGWLRHFNLWVLSYYGVGASIFPSGHVAGVTATALAVQSIRPRLGAYFIVAALSITFATVYLRYHYAADALAGLLVGVIAFVVSRKICNPCPGRSEL